MAINLGSAKEKYDANQLRSIQFVLLAYTAVFLFILYSGWITLFARYNVVMASLAALTLAFLAWGLGRYVGMTERGIARKTPLFILLLILSAAGVFNWMMITLEGKAIFLEAVSGAEDAFTKLGTSARNNVANTALAAKENDVKSKELLFLTEVRNPMNCGYGPVAQQRQRELVAVLPGLQLPSPSRTGALTAEQCGARADIYKSAIDQSWNSTTDAQHLNAIRTDQATIASKVTQAKAQLDVLRTGANTNGDNFILGVGRNELQNADETYKSQLATLLNYAPDPDVPRRLDLLTISRLGEWSQIIGVITSRLDKISTYLYLALAVFIDFMLVFIFGEYRTRKLQAPSTPIVTSPAVRHLGDS